MANTTNRVYQITGVKVDPVLGTITHLCAATGSVPLEEAIGHIRKYGDGYYYVQDRHGKIGDIQIGETKNGMPSLAVDTSSGCARDLSKLPKVTKPVKQSPGTTGVIFTVLFGLASVALWIATIAALAGAFDDDEIASAVQQQVRVQEAILYGVSAGFCMLCCVLLAIYDNYRAIQRTST